MGGLGFSGDLRGFERCVWSVIFSSSPPSVGLSFVFLSFFLLLEVLRC